MKFSIFIQKVKRKWIKLRLQPIRVFCFHHVCKQFDVDAMNDGDWMELSVFQDKVNELINQGYHFISLSDAYQHMKKDYIRLCKYAILAFDDGYSSLKEILPWLDSQKIPVILFVNGKYLDGKSYRNSPKEKYLTQKELFALNHSLIEIGSHGYEHVDATQMNKEEFLIHIEKNIEVLQPHPCYVPFHAYTWGRHTEYTDEVLHRKMITPVYVDGMKNYNATSVIHREVL